MARLDELIATNRNNLQGKMFYVGVSNLQQRICRSKNQDPTEFTPLR
jgi:hypothetical protein